MRGRHRSQGCRVARTLESVWTKRTRSYSSGYTSGCMLCCSEARVFLSVRRPTDCAFVRTTFLLGSPYLALFGEDRLEKLRLGYRAVPDGPESPVLRVDLFAETQSPGDGDDSLGGGLELRLLW